MNKNPITTELKRQHQAFGYSWAGLKATWRTEAAFRIEIPLGILFLCIAAFLDISLLEKSVLVFSILLILIIEVVNSALENALTLICKEHNPIVKIAKDQGSAAVLLALTNMIVVWTLILANRFL
jgi:diacylglycerol kinase (ATP)